MRNGPIAVGVFILGLGVQAAEARPLRYQAWWGGFHAADMVLDLGEPDSSLSIVTRGLLGRLMPSRIEALAKRGAEALSWRYRSNGGGEERRVAVVYPAGRAAKVVEDLPGPPAEALPIALRSGVVDPLNALNLMRRDVAGGRQSFVLPIYDGRRRLDIQARVLGEGRRNKRPTIELHLEADTHAGFNRRQRALWDGGAARVSLDAATLLPLRIEVAALVLTLTTRLE
ncbi:MAG: DUF3108 domain-containing protein [Alphaproteobacteria bacterium]|nr:DUF3108 domain-containing protein [Alphaproteobacteria bacterium]